MVSFRMSNDRNERNNVELTADLDHRMSDPLHEAGAGEANENGYSGNPDQHLPSLKFSETDTDQASSVMKWTTENVNSWLQKNVPFDHGSMQDFVHKFQEEGVDGLGLLTLQRYHRACAGMSDSDWLLLKASRRRLLTHGENSSRTPLNKVTVEELLGAMTPPSTPRSTRTSSFSGSLCREKENQDYGFFGSPASGAYPASDGVMQEMNRLLLLLGMLDNFFTLLHSVESLKEEVQSLRGEIVSAEERETTLQAQLDHVDEVLRTAQLSGYIYTRTRWTALPGEPPILDDTEVDDWMLRFLVLRGSTVCFYLRATDLRPQGTILLTEIVEAGPMPRKMHHKGDRRWSAFHITTCHGLRLECASTCKVQVESWLSSIGGTYVKVEKRKTDQLTRPLSGAWLKVLPPDSENLSQECDLFGENAEED